MLRIIRLWLLSSFLLLWPHVSSAKPVNWHVDLLAGGGRYYSLMDQDWVLASTQGVRVSTGDFTVDWQVYLKKGKSFFEHDLAVGYDKGHLSTSFTRIYYADGQRDYMWSVDTTWRLH